MVRRPISCEEEGKRERGFLQRFLLRLISDIQVFLVYIGYMIDDQKDENELPEKPEHKKETKKGNTAEVDLGNGIKGKINLGNLPV